MGGTGNLPPILLFKNVLIMELYSFIQFQKFNNI